MPKGRQSGRLRARPAQNSQTQPRAYGSPPRAPPAASSPPPRPNAAPKLDFCIIKAAHQHPATARWPLTIPPTRPCPPLRSLGF